MKINDIFSKTVFLLGAGASFDVGCKLSTGMMYALRDAIKGLQASDTDFIDYKNDFEEIYNFILASIQYQNTLKGINPSNSVGINIEDFVMVLRQLIDKEFIIPFPLVGNWNDKIIKWELRNNSGKSEFNIFEHFKRFIILELINKWTRFDSVLAKEVLQPIKDLSSVSEDFVLNLYSLNYDLLFEQTLNSSTARILDNGFSEKKIGDNHISYWAYDFNNEQNRTKVNLFKLHGSLDWEYSEESQEITIKENIFDQREPLIIFGSYLKMLSFDPFLFILSNFRERLSQASLFVVIGYSFHDKYINNLLIQQLSQNTEIGDQPKKMLVIDPYREMGSEERFVEEIQQIQESRSINDIINFSHINPDRIRIKKMRAKDFFTTHFSNNAELLAKELEEVEKGDMPF